MLKTVFNIVTKTDLFNAMGASGNMEVLVNGRIGNLQSVTREDGSGTKFIVKLCRYDNNSLKFVYENIFMNFGKKTY
jgi:hypothetical protein